MKKRSPAQLQEDYKAKLFASIRTTFETFAKE